ncbi:hypothetical protein [Streptomyces sp. NPDC019507]|uniref:hypothetical protein n=1 Tax=Streptomyces sp. NPDC019507 TaxID=3154689 RepID=UPI0033F1221A
MSKPFTVYRKAVRGSWGKSWWLAWPITERISVGDVLHNVDGHVRRAGTLEDRGVTYVDRPGNPHADVLHDAGGSASVRFKPAGVAVEGFSALAAAELGAAVEFSRSHSALVVYKGLQEQAVADEKALAAALIDLTWQTWDDSLLAVTQVVSAQSGTLLISESSGASVEFRLQAGLGQAPFGIADLAGGASILRHRGVSEKWAGAECTPFFRVVRLRKRWFRSVTEDYGPRQPGRGAQTEPVPPVLVDEAQHDPGAVLETVEAEEQYTSDPASE